MAYDVAIKGARIVDGTGMPGYFGDVAIQDGRIVEIGRIDGPAKRAIQADGRVLAPGFIDMHTHYDAQLSWDPIATSSCWQGVTTVMIGNCGFALAPVRPADRDYIMQMLMRVEGMSLDALQAGIDWQWETVPQFMDHLDSRLGLNAGVLVGHSTIRYHVMGPDSYEREATPEEIEKMKALVRDGIRAGAMGFSTSMTKAHLAGNGRPVPSRLATDHEILALAGVLREFNVGSIEFAPRSAELGFDERERAFMMQLSRETGRPINWNALFDNQARPGMWKTLLQFLGEMFEQGGQCYALNFCNRVDQWFDLVEPQLVFIDQVAWRRTLRLPFEEKVAALRDPEVRERLKEDMADPAPKNFSKDWRDLVIDIPTRPENQVHKGKTVAQYATETGKHPVDAFLDFALSENLETVFKMIGFFNKDAAVVEEIVKNPYSIPGVSDAGAHVDILAGYGFPADLLSIWVRERGVLTLEEGVRRLTSLPAAVCGIADRGTIREGNAADLVLFDADRIRARPPEMVYDLPGGAPRLTQQSEGIDLTLVNGDVLVEKGEHTGALPGRVIRNRRYQAS